MPRDGAITFDDPRGKLDALRVTCEACGRTGRYSLDRLIERRGPDCKVVDLLAEMTADCPRRAAGTFNDRRGARWPDLPHVM
jgi:hypothetical protein